MLLHTGYPYVRSLAYLAAMFPNVYADMGETILFAAGEATEIYRELLGLAPASKLLFSTDASLVPELYWVGARVGRRALGSRPRRAHRRRRARRARPRSTGPSGCSGATPRRSTGSEPSRRAARRSRLVGAGFGRRRRNSRSSGTSRWPRRPSRRTVMTTMKITARMIWLSP